MHPEKTVMEESICSRIRSLINYYNISDRQFAIKIGVTQSVIGSMFQKQTEPSAKILKLILNTDERISAEWLMRGKGKIFLESNQQNAVIPTTDREKVFMDVIAMQQEYINILKNKIESLATEQK